MPLKMGAKVELCTGETRAKLQVIIASNWQCTTELATTDQANQGTAKQDQQGSRLGNHVPR